jgi:YfiH family protein
MSSGVRAVTLWPVERAAALRSRGAREAAARTALPGARRFAFMGEVHSDHIGEVESDGPAELERTDALVTSAEGVGLIGTHADCQMLVLHAPKARALAMVHAGWRGLALGLVFKATERLVALYSVQPGELEVWAPPSLGVCCARFSNPTSELPLDWRSHMTPVAADGSARMDLVAVARSQLIAAGVAADRIRLDPRCTRCDPALFPSHRREGAARTVTSLTVAALER